MDTVSHRLSQYFDYLLEDGTDEGTNRKNIKKERSIQKGMGENDCKVIQSAKKRKEKAHKLTVKKDEINTTTDAEGGSTQVSDLEESTQETAKEKNRSEMKDSKESVPDNCYTDDGFKIVSFIPEDDSDVSDAFESCEEDEEDDDVTLGKVTKTIPSRTQKVTEDGFKIMSSIEADDSDISDAFEDCDDDSEDLTNTTNQPKTIKKPLMQIMDDFGIDDKVLMEQKVKSQTQLLKPSKRQKKLLKRKATTLTHAAKKKQQQQLQIINYAEKRGTNKQKKTDNDDNELPVVPKAETLDEKQLKKARYDVFKLGVSGFHKEKREDTRIALAIKLGAKPPKKKGINYKKLMEIRKEEKEKEIEEREMKRRLGLKVLKPFKKKDKPPVKAAAAQIGRYKHGVQVISRRDIAKINKS